MSKNFVAANTILDNVWYAKEYVDQDNRTINWDAIWLKEDEIAASSGELALTRLAHDVHQEGRSFQDMAVLDELNKNIVLGAVCLMYSEVTP